MSTNGASSDQTPLRIVVGSDNAGHAYKTALKEALKKHKGVSEVLDVGVVDADDSTAYPHLAVDACKKIKAGEVGVVSEDRLDSCTDISHRLTEPFSYAVLVLESPSQQTRSRASVPSPLTTLTQSNGQS